MNDIAASAPARRIAVALLGVLAVLPLAAYLWGFMVDDALITARYAHNLAAGHGYRFNEGGPISDGVTPLGFAYVLAPFAEAGPLGAYRAAKVLGLLAWCAAGGLAAVAIDGIEGARTKWLGMLLLATSAPLAAWSTAGMETGVVLGLAGVAAAARALGREGASVSAAALVGAWRPEAAPWAIAMALAPARQPARAGSRWWKLAVVVAPAAAVALTRRWVFGHAMPLGAIAKPSTVALGARYALACALLCGLVALAGFRGLAPWARGLSLAALVHWAAMAVAGGDWMPVSRLATTALPTVAIASAALAARAPGKRPWLDHAWLGLRGAAAVGGQLFVLVAHGPKLAAVEAQRFAVMDALGERLREARVVAALDIGWVGAVTPAAVIDLAGVTDPEIARLDGGHTSKRIPTWLLDAREVDTLVVRLRPGEGVRTPWYMSRFATFVDMWVATTPNVAEGFEVVATYPGEPRYVVLRRTDP